MKLRFLAFASIVLLLGGLTACSNGNATAPSTSSTKTTIPGTSSFMTTPTEKTGVEVGDKAPDFSIKDLEGNIVSSSDLAGKPVMLTFWGIG